MIPVDLFWSFRSPYCYLALDRIQAIQTQYDIDLKVRVIMPLAVRDPDYFESLPKARGIYNAMDAKRMAAFLGVPFARPQPDPVAFEVDRPRPLENQPYIHRLSRLGALACDKGQGMSFVGAVASMMWGGSVARWDKGMHLADAVASAGLDFTTMEEKIASRPEHYDALIAGNERRLAEVGHWGVPTFAVSGEAFFGQDRLDVLNWRLDQLGARRK
jgi:2-hydroxychromene-2-carboxylate isomerase